jgi:hypothetical protein
MQAFLPSFLPHLTEEKLFAYLIQGGEPEDIVTELLCGLFQVLNLNFVQIG